MAEALLLMQARATAWGKTGIASMRDAELRALPEELWSVAHTIHVGPLKSRH